MQRPPHIPAQVHHKPAILGLGSLCAEAFRETLWPTRCAVCDALGEIVCARCRRALPLIDYWRACPRCGAPFGFVQCTECNPVMQAGLPQGQLPYASCRSPCVFDGGAARIATVYKDAGEQRLAAIMSAFMVDVLAPDVAREAVITYIPATRAALRRRGFDHGKLLAEHVAATIDRPVATLLNRPTSKDQRELSRKSRFENMQDTFTLASHPTHGEPLLIHSTPPAQVLLIDDVCTTGATLAAASDLLTSHGIKRIDCVTFARVW